MKTSTAKGRRIHWTKTARGKQILAARTQPVVEIGSSAPTPTIKDLLNQVDALRIALCTASRELADTLYEELDGTRIV